jgi:hypothetical protein
VISFDVEVEADNEKDAMAHFQMQDDPSAARSLDDVLMAFDPNLDEVKAGGVIVRFFNEVRFKREVGDDE